MKTPGMKIGAPPASPLFSPIGILVFFLLAVAIVGGYFLVTWLQSSGRRSTALMAYLQDPAGHADWANPAGQVCSGAPFQFPTTGYVGYLWGDSFRPLQTHSGIDIFGGGEPGVTPVYSASGGFLTRLATWKSAVIVRVPSDPFHPGHEIWVYYTHMADPSGRSFISPDFPPGTIEKPVQPGDRLGYQGNYSGDPNSPTGVHLHLSIVLGDGNGGFRNETDIRNTLDPSPYFGLALNANQSDNSSARCNETDSIPPSQTPE